jgi:tRNA A37 threonylcarbamoyladenosine dehydratase
MCFFLCLTDINFADYLKFMEYNELFARTELLIGSDAMQQIIAKKVILFGVGGVGSFHLFSVG